MSLPRDSDSDRTQLILQPGTHVFGRYTLTAILGEGGMGVVWRARDEKLERDVALKFLPDSVRRDPEAIRDLKRETRRCLDLTHENIVRVYDFVEDPLAAAIAMEYVPGQSLSALKAARPGGCFDAADLAPLVRQLCAALDYAHKEAKIVHRDLKPANILVTDTGKLKVADFGIARSLQDTHTRQTADLRATSGTLGYMGPQQLDGEKDEPAHDFYALGATLYDLLTGKAPFWRGDIMGQIRSATPAPMAERRAELENTGAPIPPEWENTILACLAKRAADRPASAGEVVARLGLGSGDITLVLNPPPPAPATEPGAVPALEVSNAGRAKPPAESSARNAKPPTLAASEPNPASPPPPPPPKRSKFAWYTALASLADSAARRSLLASRQRAAPSAQDRADRRAHSAKRLELDRGCAPSAHDHTDREAHRTHRKPKIKNRKSRAATCACRARLRVCRHRRSGRCGCAPVARAAVGYHGASRRPRRRQGSVGGRARVDRAGARLPAAHDARDCEKWPRQRGGKAGGGEGCGSDCRASRHGGDGR
jgi:serine/threonine protein kinase